MKASISRIRSSNRLREADPATVATLAASIKEVGLINPITVFATEVFEADIMVPGFRLVAGLHRLAACESLGMTEIEVHVVELDQLHLQLAEVDENLCGTKLTPAERSLFTKRRKDIYLALHPETRATKDGAFKGNQHTGKVVGDNLSFSSDTATKTGVTTKTVEREAARGEALGEEVLAQVKGTSLDKGVELDALAKMGKDQQRDLVAKAKTGVAVSARDTKAEDKVLELQAADEFAEWLYRHAGSEVPTIITWLTTSKPADVIKGLRRYSA
jgi:ParB family chromosome partitioning protein